MQKITRSVLIEKAEKLLGWKAKYNIEDMCRHGWAYMNKK